MKAPLIIAHRTCPLDAPENSLVGIGLAAELGADAVEIDLRMSLDQRPFLMHDWTMRRTTDFPLPLELTPSPMVRRLRLQHTDEHIYSLADAL
ncbi:MAG TPA: glycerophosphodiester phosphodiesterase family protein, partial [Dehalococcoidia bacterium]|nr:glycerophosphodiester phosphodiesterase family protein [Dehalococcoidia bacterium]